RATKYMGIILRETSYPCQSMVFPALLIPVNSAKLCKPQWQVSIGPRFHLIYLTMVRAVHGLQKKLFPFIGRVDGLERISTVLFIMTGSNIKLLAANMRRYHPFIARFCLCLSQKI